MELICTVMIQVIVLVFAAAVLELLLPDNNFRSYIKMAMGLFTVCMILQPVVQLLDMGSIPDTVQKLQSSVIEHEINQEVYRGGGME